LTCKAGSVIAGSAALCRQSSDDANQPRLVLEGIMHFVFGVDGAPPGGVQFETRCLPAAP
jgi:hypothetical protein